MRNLWSLLWPHYDVWSIAVRIAVALLLFAALWLVESALIRRLLRKGEARACAEGKKYRLRRRVGRATIAACAWRASLGLSTKGRRVLVVRAACAAAASATHEGDWPRSRADEWCTRLVNQAFTAERAWAAATTRLRLRTSN